VPPIVLFDYQAGRTDVLARNFLGEWCGVQCVNDFIGDIAFFTSDDPNEVTCYEAALHAYGQLSHVR
jgi:hypothetical protein